MGVNTVIKDYGTDILNAIRENNLEKLHNILHKQLRADKKIQKLCTSDIKHRPTKKFACPLILAARQEDPRILKYMLDRGTDPNFVHNTVFSSKRIEIVTALHISADLGFYDSVQVLLDANADPNVGDHNHETPLHIAVKKADKVLARMLLSKGADPSVLDRRANAPLHIATLYGHLQLVRTLLKYNADVYQKGQGGAIAPHIAAKEGHIHLIQLFCSKEDGCVNIKLSCFADRREKALIHLAAENGHVETVLALLHQFEAKVDIKDSDENTALQCTVLNRFDSHRMRDKDYFTECAKVLIKFGVPINDKNAFGDTALHLAAMNQFQRIVEMLIEVGADPFLVNDEHLKPIDVVPDFDPVTKQLLKNAMLNPRPPPSQSMTSLRRDLDLSLLDNSSIRNHRFYDSRSEFSFDDRSSFRSRAKSEVSIMSNTTMDSSIFVGDTKGGGTDENANRRHQGDRHQEQEISELYGKVNKQKRGGRDERTAPAHHSDDEGAEYANDAAEQTIPKAAIARELEKRQKEFRKYEDSLSEVSGISVQEEDIGTDYMSMLNKTQDKAKKPRVNQRTTSSKTSTMTSETTTKSVREATGDVYDEINDQFVRKKKQQQPAAAAAAPPAGHPSAQGEQDRSLSSNSNHSGESSALDLPIGVQAAGGIRVNPVPGKPGVVEVSYDGGPAGPITISVDTNQSKFGIKTPGGEYDSETLQQQAFKYPDRPAPSYSDLEQSTDTLLSVGTQGEFEHAYSQSSYQEDYSRDNLDVSVESSELAETPHHNNPGLVRRAIQQSVAQSMPDATPTQPATKHTQMRLGSSSVTTEPYWDKPLPKEPGWNKPQPREPEFNYMNLDMMNPPPRPPRSDKETDKSLQYMNIDDIAPPRPPKKKGSETKHSRSPSPPRNATPPPRPPKVSDVQKPIDHSSPRKEDQPPARPARGNNASEQPPLRPTRTDEQIHHQHVEVVHPPTRPARSDVQTRTENRTITTETVEVAEHKQQKPGTTAKPVVTSKPQIQSKPVTAQKPQVRQTTQKPKFTSEETPSDDVTPNTPPFKSFQQAMALAKQRDEQFSSTENLDDTPKKQNRKPQEKFVSTPESKQWQVKPSQTSAVVENTESFKHSDANGTSSSNIQIQYTQSGATTTKKTVYTTYNIESTHDSDTEVKEIYEENPPEVVEHKETSVARSLVFAKPAAENGKADLKQQALSLQSDLRQRTVSPVPRIPRTTKPRESEESRQRHLQEYPSRANQVSDDPIASTSLSDSYTLLPEGGGGGDDDDDDDDDERVEGLTVSELSNIEFRSAGTRTPDSMSSEYRRSLNMRVTGDMPKAYTRKETAAARKAFMLAKPVGIESGSEASDNEHNTSFYDEMSSQNSLVYSGPNSPEPPVDQKAEVDERRKKKVKLIGPMPRPYRSFGKIETKTDALLEALEESREEIMSDPGDEPIHQYDQPVRAHSTSDVQHIVLASEIDDDDDVIVGKSSKPKRPQIKPLGDSIKVQSHSDQYLYIDAEDTEELRSEKCNPNTAHQSVAESSFKKNIKFVQDTPKPLKSYNVEQVKVAQKTTKSQVTTTMQTTVSETVKKIASSPKNQGTPYENRTASFIGMSSESKDARKEVLPKVKSVPKPTPRSSLEVQVEQLDKIPEAKPRTSLQAAEDTPYIDELSTDIPLQSRTEYAKADNDASQMYMNTQNVKSNDRQPRVQSVISSAEQKPVETSFDEDQEVSSYDDSSINKDVAVKQNDENIYMNDERHQEPSTQSNNASEDTNVAKYKHPDAGHLTASKIIREDFFEDPSPGYVVKTVEENKLHEIKETHQLAVSTQQQSMPPVKVQHAPPSRDDNAKKPQQQATSDVQRHVSHQRVARPTQPPPAVPSKHYREQYDIRQQKRSSLVDSDKSSTDPSSPSSPGSPPPPPLPDNSPPSWNPDAAPTFPEVEDIDVNKKRPSKKPFRPALAPKPTKVDKDKGAGESQDKAGKKGGFFSLGSLRGRRKSEEKQPDIDTQIPVSVTVSANEQKPKEKSVMKLFKKNKANSQQPDYENTESRSNSQQPEYENTEKTRSTHVEQEQLFTQRAHAQPASNIHIVGSAELTAAAGSSYQPRRLDYKPRDAVARSKATEQPSSSEKQQQKKEQYEPVAPSDKHRALTPDDLNTSTDSDNSSVDSNTTSPTGIEGTVMGARDPSSLERTDTVRENERVAGFFSNKLRVKQETTQIRQQSKTTNLDPSNYHIHREDERADDKSAHDNALQIANQAYRQQTSMEYNDEKLDAVQSDKSQLKWDRSQKSTLASVREQDTTGESNFRRQKVQKAEGVSPEIRTTSEQPVDKTRESQGDALHYNDNAPQGSNAARQAQETKQRISWSKPAALEEAVISESRERQEAEMTVHGDRINVQNYQIYSEQDNRGDSEQPIDVQTSPLGSPLTWDKSNKQSSLQAQEYQPEVEPHLRKHRSPEKSKKDLTHDKQSQKVQDTESPADRKPQTVSKSEPAKQSRQRISWDKPSALEQVEITELSTDQPFTQQVQASVPTLPQPVIEDTKDMVVKETEEVRDNSLKFDKTYNRYPKDSHETQPQQGPMMRKLKTSSKPKASETPEKPGIQVEPPRNDTVPKAHGQDPGEHVDELTGQSKQRISWNKPTSLDEAVIIDNVEDSSITQETSVNVNHLVDRIKQNSTFQETSLDDFIPLPENVRKPANVSINRGANFERDRRQDSALDEVVSIPSSDKDSSEVESVTSDQRAAAGNQNQHISRTGVAHEAVGNNAHVPNSTNVSAEQPFRRQMSLRGKKKRPAGGDRDPRGQDNQRNNVVIDQQARMNEQSYNEGNNSLDRQYNGASNRGAQREPVNSRYRSEPHRQQEISTRSNVSFEDERNGNFTRQTHGNMLNRSYQGPPAGYQQGQQQMRGQSHQWGQHSRLNSADQDPHNRSMDRSLERMGSTSSTSSQSSVNRTQHRSRSRDNALMGKMFAAARPAAQVQLADVEQGNDDEYRNRRYKKNKRRQHSHDAAASRRRILNTSLQDVNGYNSQQAALAASKSMGALNDVHGQRQGRQRSDGSLGSQPRDRVNSTGSSMPRTRIQRNYEADMEKAMQSMNMSTDVDDVFIPSNVNQMAAQAMQKYRHETTL